MGRNATSAVENIYFQCRKKAALKDHRLKSREGAAELLGVSPSTLADYELGVTKFIPVENVIRMADLYNAPFLKTRFCAKECPIGAKCADSLPTEQPRIELVALDIASQTAARRIEAARDDLIIIAKDGRVDATERLKLSQTIDELEGLLRGVIGLQLIEAQG